MPFKTFQDMAPFKNRRQALQSRQTGEACLILTSGSEGYISRFRAQSSFVYLTGFEEAESWLVLRLGQTPSYTLFVPEKDANLELWDGERFGPELAKSVFQADQTYSSAEIVDHLPNLLRGVDQIYFQIGQDAEVDRIVLEAREQALQFERRSGRALAAIHDPREILAPLRVIKDEHERAFMRENCQLAAEVHIEVMKATRPGVSERALMGVFLNGIYKRGASGEAYSSIVASGANATTLHYRGNHRTLQDGDLLLIDAGSEKNYLAADITRTYPVNGKFSPAQKALYSAVLEVQKKLIQSVKIGFSLPELHELSCKLLTEKLLDLGLLKGGLEDLLLSKTYSRYYPHGVGHYLGMDVHDTGVSKKGDKPNPFQEGMVITVEPGLYIPTQDETVPQEFRGLGVRIEDDILITSKGPEVMTAAAPKEIAELESLVGTQAPR